MNVAPFLAEISDTLGEEAISVDREVLYRLQANTLGLERSVDAVVYPQNTDEVRQVVSAANSHNIRLHPISCGKNLGYGDAAPARNDHVVVDLGRMKSIREINIDAAYAVVEPGVTQIQLYDALQELRTPLIADMTGAGLQASIVGNTLEGGFGHTPVGNHRHSSSDFEVVLGTGEVFSTGTFPGPGPDLTGLFVQSNFGIVTAMRVELMARPESFMSFVAECTRHSDVLQFVKELHLLRSEGVLTSLVHVGNALRSLMTLRSCPEEYQDKVMTNDDAKQLMKMPFIAVGDWTAVGGLYGGVSVCRAKAAVLKRRLSRFGKVNCFTDRKLEFIEGVLSRSPLSRFSFAAEMASRISMFRPLHYLMQGVPTDVPLDNIGWRESGRDDMGLIWAAPTTTADTAEIEHVLREGERLYREYGLEMPITITLIGSGKLVYVYSIHFNKNDEQAKEQAYALYNALMNAWADKGIRPYRQGLLSFGSGCGHYDDGKLRLLQLLKQSLDPNCTIAQGRYNIE